MKTDFLKYDASSLVEYLRRRLLDSGVYTDQIYPASDLKLLMDLFAWTFEVLQYILNNNASDVLFTDSELYSNMNRLTKLLSYSPKAYRTSTCEFSYSGTFNPNLTATMVIPKYARIETDMVDQEGKPIYFSFTEDFRFDVRNGNIIYKKENPLLYNGEYCLYTFDKLSDGSKYETFTMTQISPENGYRLDNDNFDVYVEEISETGEKIFLKIPIVDSLILNASSDDLVCERRLNENKEFEIKFGDNIHGKTLVEGTKVHVIYLKSNGMAGKLNEVKVSTRLLKISITGLASLNEMVMMLYGGTEAFKIKYGRLFTRSMIPLTENQDILFTSMNNSSDVLDYEDVTEIRENAPLSFRRGQRLVTRNDFRTYILDVNRNRVSDVYVCNNNEYMMTFYKWLDRYDSLIPGQRIENFDFMDAVDFNNVYLWLKPNNKSMNLLSSDKKLVVKSCNDLKTLTSNLVPCEGIKVYFTPYMGDEITPKIAEKLINLDNPTKIQIVRGRTYLSDATVKNNVLEIIVKYFKEHCSFGQLVSISDITKLIKALGYIENIQTVNGSSVCNGLSFAVFTKNLINFNDAERISQYINLEPFQYPYFIDDDSHSQLAKMIEIVNSDFSLKNDNI